MLVGASPSFLYSYAGGHTKSGCDSGENRDDDVEDLTPECFVCVHSACVVLKVILRIPSCLPPRFPSRT